MSRQNKIIVHPLRGLAVGFGASLLASGSALAANAAAPDIQPPTQAPQTQPQDAPSTTDVISSASTEMRAQAVIDVCQSALRNSAPGTAVAMQKLCSASLRVFYASSKQDRVFSPISSHLLALGEYAESNHNLLCLPKSEDTAADIYGDSDIRCTDPNQEVLAARQPIEDQLLITSLPPAFFKIQTTAAHHQHYGVAPTTAVSKHPVVQGQSLIPLELPQVAHNASDDAVKTPVPVRTTSAGSLDADRPQQQVVSGKSTTADTNSNTNWIPVVAATVIAAAALALSIASDVDKDILRTRRRLITRTKTASSNIKKRIDAIDISQTAFNLGFAGAAAWSAASTRAASMTAHPRVKSVIGFGMSVRNATVGAFEALRNEDVRRNALRQGISATAGALSNIANSPVSTDMAIGVTMIKDGIRERAQRWGGASRNALHEVFTAFARKRASDGYSYFALPPNLDAAISAYERVSPPVLPATLDNTKLTAAQMQQSLPADVQKLAAGNLSDQLRFCVKAANHFSKTPDIAHLKVTEKLLAASREIVRNNASMRSTWLRTISEEMPDLLNLVKRGPQALALTPA